MYLLVYYWQLVLNLRQWKEEKIKEFGCGFKKGEGGEREIEGERERERERTM